jgi:glycosyltransferase involved in cell wall biosynthesis
MKILYFAEYNLGGGPKANLNLAVSSSEFAEVAFLGIDHNIPEYKSISFLETKARKSISLRYFLDLWHSLNRFNPDIVHATGMYTGLLTLFARSVRRKKFKAIMTLHHTSAKFRYNFVAKKLVHLLNKVNIVHYLTEYQKNLYMNFGLNPPKFKIIPNISYTRTYSEGEANTLRSKLLADTSAVWLLVYLGRLVESKQLHIFIETIKKINHQGFNAGGVIVGSGDKSYTKGLMDLVAELDIASKIVFIGFSQQPELYIKSCDFCLFPTLHAEALPLFILESFSQNKTMVVSNHPSISGIVSDHFDSLVAEEHTSEIYARKCIEIIEHPQLRKQLEMGAGHTYNRYYKPEKAINEFNKMYLEIMRE